MDALDSLPKFPTGSDEDNALRELLGYLNFSSGQPDTKFQSRLNQLAALLAPATKPVPLRGALLARLETLPQQAGAFSNISQARSVIEIVFDCMIPAYQEYHKDILAHVDVTWYYQPFLVARFFEAVLAQGGPWNEIDRIVAGALIQVNDFIGHRPVPVLENRRHNQPYSHERFRPVPLYIRNVGVAVGPYESLVSKALTILRSLPSEILTGSYFDLNLLDELALDLRAYDNAHPVNRRTNYTFGEWDPHKLDVSGRYRRFVIRAVILDALNDWIQKAKDVPVDERISEAAAVLAGTMLMASSISGSGPDTHNSNITLTNLLPKVARQRDAFYQLLLRTMTGKHADRLRKEAQVVQQPFGKIRQYLNLYLANYGCQQLQRSHLAWLYARMGYSESARKQAQIIPAAATRFETEMQIHMTQALLHVEQGASRDASESLKLAEALIHRGIECGAFVDPWNILGFQGQFPLFSSRDDAVPDPRIDHLLTIMEQLFATFGRAECEAAAQGDRELVADLHHRFNRMAEFWDQFASTTVADLQPVNGAISRDSAERVSRVILAWRDAGEAAGDLGFWKRHVEELDSPRAYATVIDLLLRKRDVVASMNLLIQWLSQSETVPLEGGPSSFCPLLDFWVRMVIDQGKKSATAATTAWEKINLFFERIDVNAGEWGRAPHIEADGKQALKLSGELPHLEKGLEPPTPAADPFDPFDSFDEKSEEEDDEDPLFQAAYENVVFRDSANDGNVGDTMDGDSPHIETDLDLIIGPLEQRLRFLSTLSDAWVAAAKWAIGTETEGSQPQSDLCKAAARVWSERNELIVQGLVQLLERLNEWQPSEPLGDPDSLAEYDRQLHLKFSVLTTAVNVVVSLQENSRTLRTLTREAKPAPARGAQGGLEERIQRLLGSVEKRNLNEVRELLPPLLKQLSRMPLLYVPLDKDGRIREILAARSLQGLLRLLLKQLPQLGLFRETWHVLRTAYQMERANPPSGMSITEFDRLLETGLQSTLQVVMNAAHTWGSASANDRRLLGFFDHLLTPYVGLWMKHSSTMRLSTVEILNDRQVWREIKGFIKDYGADLFHPRMLSIGNLRGIVQRGAEAYLDYLEENADPLHPVRLLEDLGYELSREHAAENLEVILRSIVEKFDRFLEYNSTTTQSDYGEQLHCLLDFQRLEAEYDRDDWNLTPFQLGHNVLARAGRSDIALAWQQTLEKKTASMAKNHLQKLKKLEKTYGMRLPSVTDRIGERFIKPLVLDSILALVRPSMDQKRNGEPLTSFPELEKLAEEYLSTTSGSPTDIQPWMQKLGDEVQGAEIDLHMPVPFNSQEPAAPLVPITAAHIQNQLEIWDHPLH